MFLDIGSKPGFFGLLALGIATTVVAQDVILLDQSNFVYLLNNSNPSLNGGSYQVTEDITLLPNWIWTPVGTEASPASLNFNGSYHVINGLRVETTTANTPTALFGYLVDSWVHSVILILPSVLSHGDGSETGTIVGKALRTNITDNLVIGGSVGSRGDTGSSFNLARYAYAGGITGSASHSRIENNLNNATVHTTGSRCYAAGVTANQEHSTTSNNINMGDIRTTGSYADASGITALQTSSTTRNNINMGDIETTGSYADASGITAFQSSSTTSNNINMGDIETTGPGADASGITANQQYGSTTSNNMNMGDIGTTGQSAKASGITADQRYDSTTSDNMNIGDIGTTGKGGYASGITAFQISGTTSNNINTGGIETTGQGAEASGITAFQFSSTTSNNINTGDIGTMGLHADASGIMTLQLVSGTTSDNLNSGSVMVDGALASVITSGVTQVEDSELQIGLNGLDGTFWNAGNDSQFPMLRGINAAYRDLQRINDTRYGNNLFTFPMELNQFADPGGSMDASLFDQCAWNVRDGYLPFLKAVGRDRAEAAGIDCSEGGFACDRGRRFTPQSSGSLEHLLYDGHRYHGIVRSVGGLAYWAAYEGGHQVALASELCGVYDFTDLSLTGIVVDAAASDGDNAYVAYHVPEQAQSLLAVFTLSGQQVVSSSTLGLDRVAGLSIDDSYILLNTGQDICQLSVEDMGQGPECGGGLLNPSEEIQTVAGDSGDLYLLVHQEEAGYQIRMVRGGSHLSSFVVSIPREATLSAITPTLKVIGRHLHLLLADQGLVIWRQYPLDGLPVMSSDVWESEATAPLPRDITPTTLSLIPKAGQGQVFVLGHEAGQPRYVRLAAADFSPSSDAGTKTGTDNWPSWAQAVTGTTVAVAGTVALGTAGIIARKVYTHFRPEAKDDMLGRIYEKLRRSLTSNL